MDRRRQTLGTISPSQLNSRASLAPSRITQDGKSLRKPSLLGSRPSLVGGRGQGNNAPSRLGGMPAGVIPRRSSTYGKPSNGVKPDPRPVNDKGYQANCVRCLIGFLSTHGFDQPISPKLLASPMSKDFTAIVQFLMRQVDPNLGPKSFGKIEDDVPTFFKRMRYPFQISKSSLFAVGSPHTWPSLLASLVWLTELLSYVEKADLTKAELVDEKQRAESDFFEYVSQSYRFFLSGDDYQCQAVDDAKGREFEERADEIRSHNQQLQQENERLRAQIEAMRRSPSPLVAAKAKKEEHLSDREKFHKLIENLQSHKQALQLKLQERQVDLKSKREQLIQAEQECAELGQRIAGQTFKREDVIRMADERAKQDEILQSAEAARDVLQRRVREQEVTIEHRLDELEGALQDYNTTADRLQLIPVTAKRAAGVQFEVKLSRGGSTASEIVNVDFKGSVKVALGRVRETAILRARQLCEEALALQERLDTLAHGLTERTEENAILTTQVHKVEKQLTASKEAREAEVCAIQAQAEQLKAEVADLRNVTSQSIAHSQSRYHTLQVQYEEVAQACEIERSLFNQDMAAALHAVFEHKESLVSMLQKVHSRVAAICVDLPQLVAV